MKRFKVELIKDFKFPIDPDFLNSSIGIFCREIHHKKWLEADEGSIGHQLMQAFLATLDKPECLTASLYEIKVLKEIKEEIELREYASSMKLLSELSSITKPPNIPRYSAFRTVNGQRQGLLRLQWVDISEES